MIALRLAVVLVTTVVAGCGDDTAAMKADFVARSDAISSLANERVGRRPRAGDVFEVQRPDARRRVLGYYERFVEAERTALGALRAGEPPEGDERAVDAFLTAFERMIGYAEESLVALRAHDLEDFRNSKRIRRLFELAADVELRAAAYGFEDCTQLGIR